MRVLMVIYTDEKVIITYGFLLTLEVNSCLNFLVVLSWFFFFFTSNVLLSRRLSTKLLITFNILAFK